MSQGWPGELTLSMPQIRMGFCHPTGSASGSTSKGRCWCGATGLDSYLHRSSAGPPVLVAETTANRRADVPSGLDPLPGTQRVG